MSTTPPAAAAATTSENPAPTEGAAPPATPPKLEDESTVLPPPATPPPAPYPPAPPTPTSSTTPKQLQDANTFEDDGTFALPPGQSYKTTTPLQQQQQSTTPVSDSKGAQILMNRFSNWKKQAGDNANVLWKQAKEAQEKAAATNQGPLAVLRQAAGVIRDDDDDEEEEESSSRSVSSSEDDESESGDYHHQDDGDDAPTSARSLPNIPTRKEMRHRVSNLATGAMDSVAPGFIGRYANAPETPNNNNNSTTLLSPRSSPSKESQTSLILKSRAAGHLQDILDSLEPYQYVLLLGAGRLQVNLKNPYDSKHQGTYVDYLVRGGAAEKSGVVAVGDAIVRVGPQQVVKQTIADVPNIIAQAKRPVVLVLTTGVELEVERINYLDVAVAMMHQIRAKDDEQKQAMIASAQKPKVESKDQESSDDKKEEAPADSAGVSEEEQKTNITDEAPTTPSRQAPSPLPSPDGPKEETPEDNDVVYEKIKIPVIRSVEDYANPPQPPMEARRAYKHLVGKRCNDGFNVTQFSQVAASNDNFRAALRNAFLCCSVDGRRFPYLGRHLTMEQDALEISASPKHTTEAQTNKNSPNALLMLFLELLNFSDLHAVTPPARRRQVALRIAHKFFLPTKMNTASGGTTLEAPMFDMHSIVPDSVLRQLETNLNNEQAEIAQDIFLDFQHAVVDALCGTTFLLFLVSNHCARMRAYLRNVAPFVNVLLKPVFEALITVPTGTSGNNALSVHSGAKNYFLYLLIYLIQLEKEPTSSLSTDDSTLLGRNGRRMVGAAGGLCCYLYIGRTVVPSFENVKDQPQKPDGASKEQQLLVEVVGQLWHLFLVPGVGALEHSWKSKETKEIVESLRGMLRAIRKSVLSSTSGADEKIEHHTRRFAEGFASNPLFLKSLKDLADHLLYDYAIHSHSKFREHNFHEWMCSELVKGKKELAKLGSTEEKKEESTEEKNTATSLPDLPSGCIKRLLRKVDLPKGVSPHKPIHSIVTKNITETESKPAGGSSNAECAIVFGTSVGSDLAVQMMSPAMDQSDIRRYTCQDVTVDGDKLPESFEEQMIPPTLESYAVLPPTRATGFSEVTGNVCISSDGWEVSMINFLIPKADDGSGEGEDQNLYGVSLVFQRSSTARFHPRRVSQTQLVHGSSKADEKKAGAAIDDDGKFPSPLSFTSATDDHWSTFNRSINATEETPKFNSYLREKVWVDRVLQDDTRDQNIPATVGVALVSRKNVVISMRQTLWMLLRDFSRMPEDKQSSAVSNKDVITCGSLVDILGNFAHQDVEGMALKCVLEPYMRAASSPWIERPLSAQKEEFERLAGQQLITCLPPIPLALLFVAALLEQKIILSSSRRGILFSATEALKGMLKPLKWCHLLVPLVPSALAKDLIQYPAPFILGMNSEDPGVMEIMNDLPMDVTLVDLDVGRVILAPELSFDSSGFNEPVDQSPAQTMTALRSQVLYLAQILGSHFGAKLFRDAWSCDSPSLTFRKGDVSASEEAPYDILKSVTTNFIEELLAGVSSSCFWIEEEPDKKGHSQESTVLFDEDRFFHIKRWREEQGFEPLLQDADDSRRSLALSMDGFNLVLETFVRCQSMNWYLSSQPKSKMVCSL